MVPLVVVSSIDPVMPQVLASGLLCDVPDLTVIRHEISAAEHRLRRVVTRADRVEEDVDVELEHTCLSCALRADIVPTVVRVAAQQPAAIALVLPVTADPVPAVHALARLRGDGVRVRATVAAVDAHRFEWDLLGNDLLAERDLAFTPEDRRSVGEALARQVESADVLALDGDLGRRASVLLDHLVGGEPRRVGLLDLQPADVLDPATPFSWIGRGDPARARPTGAAADCGIWTVDLQSWRPFHPHRLREQLERLGTGPLRARPAPPPTAGSGPSTSSPGVPSTRTGSASSSSASAPARSAPAATSGCPPAPGCGSSGTASEGSSPSATSAPGPVRPPPGWSSPAPSATPTTSATPSTPP